MVLVFWLELKCQGLSLSLCYQSVTDLKKRPVSGTTIANVAKYEKKVKEQYLSNVFIFIHLFIKIGIVIVVIDLY